MVMHEKDGEAPNGVAVETELQHTGWAVFTGCDGDTVHFVAYFADYRRAQAYIDMCEKLDSESDWKMMDGDASVVPAIIDPEDGAIMWANTGALEQGAEALCQRHGIEPYDASVFIKEAHKAAYEQNRREREASRDDVLPSRCPTCRQDTVRRASIAGAFTCTACGAVWRRTSARRNSDHDKER
jgi:ribosomal protein L37AE/L43A